MIKKAILLAAGKGERMRPLTDHMPKPLLPVGDKPLLAWNMDKVFAAGVQDIIINVSHLGSQLIDAFDADERITFSKEETPLETAGGILNCLNFFEGAPFFAINGDVLWADKTPTALEAMMQFWDPDKMDILLLLVPLRNAVGYEGPGNYFQTEDQRIRRRLDGVDAPYVFAGVQILNPKVFQGQEIRVFSSRDLYDVSEKKGRLYGIVHTGGWFHLGTPQTYEEGAASFLEHESQHVT